MAITNPNLAYAHTYDLYVDRNTHVIYKRNHRGRKTEITDEELVVAKLYSTYDGYIQVQGHQQGHTYKVGIHRVYADAFPDLVENHEFHDMDPEAYNEIDHKNHIHDTIEASWCTNLRWVSSKVNRADTSRRVITPDSESHANQLKRASKYYHEHKQDPEWLATHRKKNAAIKNRHYYERKDQMAAKSAALNEQMAKLAAKSK